MRVAHVDSRKVIVTDKRHTQASPLYEETYARLAEVIPPLARERVVVMGGFIASTEEGTASTLGRGGSDFTASHRRRGDRRGRDPDLDRCRWHADQPTPPFCRADIA